MLGWLRQPPWPPELEPGETVLLEGRASARRFWATACVIVIVAVPLMLVVLPWIDRIFDWVVPERPRQDKSYIGLLFWVLVFSITLGFWRLRQSEHWMLTRWRFIQQGKGAIPRSEIGAIKRNWPGVIVIHRDGADELLKGWRFILQHVDDSRGVRDALERLK